MVTIDDSNPSILHSSNNPSIALVSHLTSENYNSWKKAMRMALHGKNKYEFVDGLISEPTLGHSTHALWHRNDNIVSSWLLNSLSKEMQVSILHCSFAKAICDDLKERFEQRNGPLIFQLKHELITLQQGSMSVSSFYSKLRSLWESLSELKPSHSCTCGGIKPWYDFEQPEYAMQFLVGLNEFFSTIRGQILSMDPFPSATKDFALIVQEEKQKEVGASTSGTSASEVSHAFAFKNSSDARNNSDNRSKGSSKNRPLCAHCDMLGYT
ncbi:Retrovirus-related Pol polyprotein from transposon RE1 [Glycine soja]